MSMGTRLDDASSSPFPSSGRQDCSSRAWYPDPGRERSGKPARDWPRSPGASGLDGRSLDAAGRGGPRAALAPPGGDALHLRPHASSGGREAAQCEAVKRGGPGGEPPPLPEILGAHVSSRGLIRNRSHRPLASRMSFLANRRLPPIDRTRPWLAKLVKRQLLLRS